MSFKIKFTLLISPDLFGLAVFNISGVAFFMVCDRLLLCVPVRRVVKRLKTRTLRTAVQ